MEFQQTLVYEVLEDRFPGGGSGSHMQSTVFEKPLGHTFNNEWARGPNCASIRIPEKERGCLHFEVFGGLFMFGLLGIWDARG